MYYNSTESIYDYLTNDLKPDYLNTENRITRLFLWKKKILRFYKIYNFNETELKALRKYF